MNLAGIAKDLFLKLVSQNAVSKTVGLAAQWQAPPAIMQRALRAFIRAYNIDINEMVLSLDQFTTFNDFFIRELVANCRPIDHLAAQVSPADGVLSQFGPITDGQLCQLKGISYRTDDLLLDSTLAAAYEGGLYYTIYLSPQNYHRVHSPIEGDISRYRYIPGKLYPVNQLAVERVDRLFTVNERIISFIDGPHGEIALVMVGATSVGRMTVKYCNITTNSGQAAVHNGRLLHPYGIKQGEEIGRFNLGSTVVVLIPKSNLKFDSAVRPGVPVKLGQALLHEA